jgi:predicted GNAT family acetyltransferase
VTKSIYVAADMPRIYTTQLNQEGGLYTIIQRVMVKSDWMNKGIAAQVYMYVVTDAT